nr:hypothetical protein [Tanacetum cinerariifolium]
MEVPFFFGEANQASKSVLRLGIAPIGLAASGNLLCIIAFSSFQSLVHERDSLAGRSPTYRTIKICLARVRFEPERISDRLEDPVSHAPLAFNSQANVDKEGREGALAFNSEQNNKERFGRKVEETFLYMIIKGSGKAAMTKILANTTYDREKSTYNRSASASRAIGALLSSYSSLDGSNGLRRSFPTKIEKPVSHRDLGNKVPSESLLRLLPELFSLKKIKAASAFRSALWLLAIKSEVTFERGETSTWDDLSLGYDLNSIFKKEPDQANQEIGSDEGERENYY